MDRELFDKLCGGDDCYEHLTRRNFGAWTLAVGFVAASRTALAAQPVKETDVTIKTPDGECDAYLVHPATGAHPAVIMWPDIFGLRPVAKEMAKRLAAEGYTVLMPNPFYRSIKGTPESQEIADLRKYAGPAGAEGTVEKDAVAFTSFLDTQPAAKKGGKMGALGYCMSGPFTVRAAATLPDRIAAAVSFHGGGLATDQPNSPHLLAPKIKAKYHFAVAANDDQREPEAKNKLKAAFEAAKNPADIEVYEGANHGWTIPGSQAYNEPQAEKAWAKMLALFKKNLV